MGRYGSGFREPPWVMGAPKEVMDWVEASHPSKKEEDKHKYEKEFLKNLHIRFDFDVSQKEMVSPHAGNQYRAATMNIMKGKQETATHQA